MIKPEIEFDFENAAVIIDGTRLRLSLTHRLMLQRLYFNFGRATHHEVLESLSESNGSIKVHITRLRRILAPFNLDINSIYGFGYELTYNEDIQLPKHKLPLQHRDKLGRPDRKPKGYVGDLTQTRIEKRNEKRRLRHAKV